jgi:hypothetical protein
MTPVMGGSVNLISLAIAALWLAANASVAVAGSSTTTQPPSDDSQSNASCYCVPIAKYVNHMAVYPLESLHRIQINDIAGLRNNLEQLLASNIHTLWGSIQDEHTSKDARDQAYSLLRQMAIQNEKFPVSRWNSDPEIATIFQAAIDNDPKRAAWLRRQNWNKPKWVEPVD